MSRTVKIPDNYKPTWECEINGIKYSYPAGSTQTVPDEVGTVIDNYNACQPVEAAIETLEQEITRLAAGVADGTVAAALEQYPVFVDLSSVLFTPGTAKAITAQLPKAVALALIDEAFDRPTSVCVKYSSVKYTLTATKKRGEGNSATLVFSAPITSEGEVQGFLVFELSVEGNIVDGLLQYTEMPEPEE